MHLPSFILSSLLLVAVIPSSKAEKLNVVELARRLGIYSYLYALEETGNTDFVATTDNITVFIPSNQAFKNVPESTRDYWRKNPDYYQNLMRYHVVQGRNNFHDLKDEDLYKTYASPSLSGRYVNYTTFSNDVKSFTGAVIDPVNTDIQASNGVIHIMNDVIAHMQTETVLQNIANMPDHSSILQAIYIASGINATLSGEHPVTFFAPTNEAIANLPNGTWAKILKDPNQAKEILELHIALAGTWFSAGLTNKLVLQTYNKIDKLTVYVNQTGVQLQVVPTAPTVSTANVLLADLAATNGVFHTIDAVLLPSPGLNLSRKQ